MFPVKKSGSLQSALIFDQGMVITRKKGCCASLRVQAMGFFEQMRRRRLFQPQFVFPLLQDRQESKHFLLKAKDQNYQGFYEHEIKAREEYNYPPFSTLVRFISSSEEEVVAIETANKFHELIYNLESFKNAGVEILGPCPCMLSRLNRKFRYHLLIKIPKLNSYSSKDRNYNHSDTLETISTEKKTNSNNKHNTTISDLKQIFLNFKKPRNVTFSIDVDSISLY